MLKSFAMTDVGQQRESNQDYVYTSEQAIGSLPNLFVVADGMGGHQAGDFASKFAVQTLVEEVKKSSQENPVTIIKTAIDSANEQLIQVAAQSEELRGMGTTLVIATIIGQYLYTANVGDSRLYLLRQGELMQVTQDHSLVEEMVRIGEINQEEAKHHPDKNIITRAIGASREVMVDFFNTKLEEGDRILLCSDGLTNMVEDKEIIFFAAGENPLEESVLGLIDQANRNGGKDNISVIIIEPFASEVKTC